MSEKQTDKQDNKPAHTDDATVFQPKEHIPKAVESEQTEVADEPTVIMHHSATDGISDEKTVIQPRQVKDADSATVIVDDSQKVPTVDDSSDEATVLLKQAGSSNQDQTIAVNPGGTPPYPTGATSPTYSPSGAGAGDFQARPGAVVKDRFELLAELGEGGMGSVFKARDQRRVEAEDEHPNVAIKLLTQNFARHPKAFVTLQRETKKTQALAHPNIVTVYDFDRDGDVVFMTMEELDGQTLQDLIAEQKGCPMDKDLGVSIIRGIAAGLIYAHSKGIVHSDLKPGNIFVTKEGHVKILDFGIARVVDESLYQDRFDVGELSALTPRYASIEMLEHLPPDPRDDLFALGIIACEILGGQHPYGRRTAAQVKQESVQAKLPQLGRLQQKALRSAIAIDAKDRAESVEKWLKSYDFARQGYKKWLLATCVLIVAIVGNLFYISEVSEPQIALSELTQAQQQSFEKNMQEAELALSFGDLNGALFYLDKSYTIHAQNEQVTEMIKRIIDSVASSIKQNNLESKQVEEVLATLGDYAAFQTDNVREQMDSLARLK